MNTSGLSLDQSPPFGVPAPYLATAPLFVIAAGLFVAFFPDALQNRWTPKTLALTHLLTLGVAAMAMVGAFQQLLPVLAGAPVQRPRLVGRTIYMMLAGGATLLPIGLFYDARLPVLMAMGLLGTAFTIFILVGLGAVSRARSAHATVGAMAAALSALLVTAGLGLYLAAGHGGLLPLARQFTDLHAIWGLLGWVGLLLMGVAFQVVPMFQITPPYPRLVLRGLVPSLFIGILALSAAKIIVPAGAGWVGGLMALGVALFAITTLLLQEKRRRQISDVTVDYWRVAMGSLLLAVTLWGVSEIAGRPQPTVLLGVLFIVGFAVSAIGGMSYKIVPFLVWLHLNNLIFTYPHMRGRAPNMKQVIPSRRTRVQFRLHVVALVLLLVAVATGDSTTARGAGALLAVAGAGLAYNIWGALLLYMRLVKEGKKGS